MIAVTGEKRIKHFRHKIITEINCSPETYLHKLTKIKFYKTYLECLRDNKPFNIKILMNRVCNFYEKDFLVTCELESQKIIFDLTKYFKKIFIESREQSFIPDILLESENENKEKIFFEVAVTHKSTQEKINSGYRIIEFAIFSEQDIEIIESCLLEEGEAINFLNFNRFLRKTNLCKGKCDKGILPYSKEPVLYRIFIIYKNGQCVLTDKTLEEISLLRKYQILNIEYISRVEATDTGIFFRRKVVESYQNGFNVENCFLCRYHGVNYSFKQEGTIFCKYLKNTGNSNMAANCEYFRPDHAVFSKYKNS